MGRKTRISFPRLEVELADTSTLPARRGLVLKLAARGKSSKEIARVMGISADTVEWHLNELKDQFHARSRLDLISQGWMHGILQVRSAVLIAVFSMSLASLMPTVRSRIPSRPTASAVRIGRDGSASFYA
ncbi:helix-turn-helix domain-containing protein [Marinobacter sp. X15-166B]|uniref:helix-turn-helix domain-containing protein n=1 Tax=Marinobacter sp. X15-166B TaxID=1897620 RepID=UPI00085C160C|nr:helix-turn-helix transcriptional regulator [Marinobacter sp. X15-166B]OEY66825.1 hypothetical protein BG841_10405 [Marinobacter sp. X15-166B]